MRAAFLGKEVFSHGERGKKKFQIADFKWEEKDSTQRAQRKHKTQRSQRRGMARVRGVRVFEEEGEAKKSGFVEGAADELEADG